MFKKVLICLSLTSSMIAINASAASQVIYDAWYTVNIKNKPYAYFNEKLEKIDNKLILTTETTKLDGERHYTESATLTSIDNDLLTPDSYSIKHGFAKNEVLVTGKVTNNIANATINYGKLKSQNKTVSLSSNAFYFEMINYFLAKKNLKKGDKLDIKLFPEDDYISSFKEIEASVKIKDVDNINSEKLYTANIEIVKKTSVVKFNDKGLLISYISDDENEEIKKSTKEDALKFLPAPHKIK